MEHFEKIIKKINSNTKNLFELNRLYSDVADIMLEKLDLIKFKPQNMLNLGSGLGIDTKLLKNKYPQTSIFQIDIAINSLKQQQSLFKKLFRKNNDLINADSYKLPFLNNSFDMVWSNLLLPYIVNLDDFFAEIKRILKPQGILLVSGFGVDSLSELRRYNLHTYNFPDLHLIGDILFKLGFIDPVTDIDYINYRNNNFATILNLIRKLGCGNNFYQYKLSKSMYEQIFNQVNSLIDIKLEIFYAYAIKREDNNLNYIKINPLK